MIKKALGVSAIVLVALSGAAHAAGEPNRYAFDEIAAKNLKAAEMRLDAQRAKEPTEPSVLLNLAYVYSRTGRAAEARTLYNEVLAQPDVLMALGDGRPASSHDIALKAMDRPNGYAAR
ncbi:tetratricopeptide repeat protein [Sphingomonas sp. LaA6.9]|uniref:tetratricopeptide repeat protein n=1 Tax=Sphingomonas sp. LaA6.9 TaxID=2919914 RepID=UPI001F4F8909|nr:tetratricopeptide repeat protein [Sphingomonas sp. LaA6.9]MCJ8157757.1 tetratricopeptide repeat protein [Sphingomonas sp. LaA6.9]